MRNVILSLVVVAVMVAGGLGGTFAGFVDTEESTGNFIQAGILDLLVNGSNDPGAKLQYIHAVPCISQDFYIDLFSWSECQGATAYMEFKNVNSVEAGAKTHLGADYVYDGETVLGGDIPDGYKVATGVEPIGAGVASSEPELIAEEGNGTVAGIWIPDDHTCLQGVDYASGVSEHLGVLVEVCDDGSDGILDDADDDGNGEISTVEYAAHNWVVIDSLTDKLDTLDGVKNELGFMLSQTYAWLHVVVHLQQIECIGWPDAQTKWWPTNALQGDKATWDMMFELNTD